MPCYGGFFEGDSISAEIIIGTIIIALVILGISAFVIYRIVLWQKSKKEINNFPESNYLGVNNNFL